MNKSVFQRIKEFVCCSVEKNKQSGHQFGLEEFSLDSEFNQTKENVETKTDLSTTTETTTKTKESLVKIEDKVNNSGSGIYKTDKKEAEHKVNKTHIRQHVLNKLDLSESDIKRVQNERKQEKEINSVNEMTVDELNDILSSVSEIPEESIIAIDKKDDKINSIKKVLKHLDLKRKKQEENQTKEKIVKISKEKIQQIEISEETSLETEELVYEEEKESLRNTKLVVENITSSGESLSLEHFKRSAPNSSESSSSAESEITCFIKYSDKTTQSKCLAEKMKKHLNSNRKL